MKGDVMNRKWPYVIGGIGIGILIMMVFHFSAGTGGNQTEDMQENESEYVEEDVSGVREESAAMTVFDAKQQQADEEGKEQTISDEADTSKDSSRVPSVAQPDGDVMTYDPENTIYYKTYYDDFTIGKIMHIDYTPYMEMKEELEDYFEEESNYAFLDHLVSMFYDNRTIELEEEELEELFREHGYLISFHNTEFREYHLRVVEITKKDGVSLYPFRILMQTWDDNFIYLQDITGPIPRRIVDMMAVDKAGTWQLIMHSSGFSKEYVAEEELIFWEFTGSYWILVPIQLEIDTSHAFSLGDLYPDMQKDIDMSLYRDGIAFPPNIQPDNSRGTYRTYRWGSMETVAENQKFRLYAVLDGEGMTEPMGYAYIEFQIDQNSAADLTDYSAYEKKIWMPEERTEGEPPLISLAITKINDGVIEGYWETDGYVDGDYFDLPCRNADLPAIPSFHGKIYDGTAECDCSCYDYDCKDYREGMLMLTFCEGDRIEVELDCDEIISCRLRPYHISDIPFRESASFDVELDTWGELTLSYGIFETDHSYPCAFLCDDQGDILYKFEGNFINGIEIKDITIEDFNGDNKKDVKVVLGFSGEYADPPGDGSPSRFEHFLYQLENGFFYLGMVNTYDDVDSDSPMRTIEYECPL